MIVRIQRVFQKSLCSQKKENKLVYFLCLCSQAVGGNIMTASPISDLNPVFMAAGCKLTLMDKGW